MKLILFLSVCMLSVPAMAQIKPKVLSPADSAKVDEYWRKANSVRLFSQKRQLYLDSALAIAPLNAYFWQQKAMPLSKQMKHDLAAPFLDSAAKYNPQEYVPYRGYTRCIFSRHHREALQDFYLSKQLNGNSGVMDHPYDLFIGLCHLQLDNIDSSRYYIWKCIENKKKQHGANWVHYLHWFYYGITWYEQDNYAKAVESFDEALRLNPVLPEALYYKALCRSAQGNKKEALTLALHTDSLLKKGYFINEDNARYEVYPYQVRKFYLESTIDFLERAEK